MKFSNNAIAFLFSINNILCSFCYAQELLGERLVAKEYTGYAKELVGKPHVAKEYAGPAQELLDDTLVVQEDTNSALEPLGERLVGHESLDPVLGFLDDPFVSQESQSKSSQQFVVCRICIDRDSCSRVMTRSCTLYGTIKEYENSPPEFSWHCELDPKDANGKKGIMMKIEGYDIPSVVYDANGAQPVVSGEFTMWASAVAICDVKGNEHILIPPGRIPKLHKPQHPRLKKKIRNRELATTTGNKPVLVVRVIGNDRSTTGSSAALSDSIFGTSGDPINLKTQYSACSYGKINVIPGTNQGGASLPVVNGVVEVAIPNTISGADDLVIQNAVTSALTSNGFDLPGNYHHVMYCLPPGTSGGWLAYAYLNSWLSVYNDQWCTYVSAQMHEVGHNLNLEHAGEGSDEYADISGMMGYSYSEDDTPKMCFNAPKSWQLGWYSDRHTTINPLIDCWRGELVGISDYARSAGKTVILKINTQSAGRADFFVNFNHRSGINSGTLEGADQVMITRQEGEGSENLKSLLLTTLNSGQSYSIGNFDGSGQVVTITVVTIDLARSPPTAVVTVERQDCSTTSRPTTRPTTPKPSTPLPTPPPTQRPPKPTPPPTQRPLPPRPTLPPNEIPPNTPVPTPKEIVICADLQSLIGNRLSLFYLCFLRSFILAIIRYIIMRSFF